MKNERPFVRWELQNKPSKRSFNMIVLQLTQVKRTQIERPKECPHCEGETFQRWGEQTRRVKDSQIRTVKVYRYRCTSCSRTFRHYPEGITHAQQSERMKQLAVICWSFGLSYRKVEAILSAFGVSLSRMSSWRDVQAGAEGIRSHYASRHVSRSGTNLRGPIAGPSDLLPRIGPRVDHRH